MADQKISELTAFTALIDTDVFPMTDITAVQTKKTTWANIKSVLKTYFDTLYTLVPTGSVSAYGASSAPTGWLVCDGTAINRTTYSALFAIISTTYGVGDGSTTFNLPNLKGRVVVGYTASETEFDALGETGGEKTHTLTGGESGIAAHSHSSQYFTTGSADGNQSASYIYVGGQKDGGTGAAGPSTSTAGDTSAASAHNNLQPYITLQYIIKT